LDSWVGVQGATAVPGASSHLERGDLAIEIAQALGSTGQYLATVSLGSRQEFVDLNWAAREAGRRLGTRVHLDVQISKAPSGAQAEVRVSAQRPPD